MNNKSISVIGCGIIGVCCALKLQSQGFQVTIIDKDDPVSGCSSGNAGHFGTEQIFPMASTTILRSLPAILLDPKGALSINPSYFFKAFPWMVRFLMAARKSQYNKGTQGLRNLNQFAISAYQPLIKMAKAEHLIHKKGYLLAFEGSKALKLAKQEYNKLVPYDFPQKIVEGSAIKELEPQLNNCNAAVYYPDIQHSTDPLKFTKALFDSFINQGGQFVKKEVLRINPISSNEINIETSEGLIRTNKVIVATGAMSKNLVKPLGHKIPLDTERGYHLMLLNQKLLNRPVAFAQRRFIMTPMQQGLRLAGTVEIAGLDKPPNWQRADMLLEHAKKFLNPLLHLDANDCEKWMGFRPTFPDSLPVIDQDEKHINLFYAFGHQHLGLTQGAITADLISNLVNAEKPAFDMQPYSINRFNWFL